jgi:hypothetical protein
VDKSQTTVDDINLTVHNSTALGRVNLAYDNDGEVNGSIDSTSYYCSECHYPGNDNRSAMIDQFTNAGFEAPQNNTYNVSGDPSYFYNHSDYLQANNYSDNICRQCHGSQLSGSAKMDEFAHNVGIGQLGNPNCVSCHDLGGEAGNRVVNVSALIQGIHANLNNRTDDPGTSDTLYNWKNRLCWACHNNGSVPATNSMGENKTNPWGCPDCHVSGRPQYGKYFKNGGNTTDVSIFEHNPYTGEIITSVDCQVCHNKSVRPSFDSYIPNAKANVSHYGTKDDLKVGSGLTSTKDCIGCHKESAAESAEWFAIYLPAVGYSLMGTSNASTCWDCHVDPPRTSNIPTRSFHESGILAQTGWVCTDCH